MKYQDYKYYFFIGIGGIGMSSLAKYLNLKNKQIAGYDREKTEISKNLEKAGIDIIYNYDFDNINQNYKNCELTLVVYTPAISDDDIIFKFFKNIIIKKIKTTNITDGILLPESNIPVSPIKKIRIKNKL